MRCLSTARPRTSIRSALLIALLAATLTSQSPASSVPSSIDSARSNITVYVYKRGLFSFMADNHEISAPIASGAYDGASRTIDVRVKAAALKVLDPKLSEDTRAKVQTAMDSSKVLDIEKYPNIDFRSTSIAASGRSLKITGDLSLHGQTHPIIIQAQQTDATHFSGSTTIRQTDFGITPIKVAGGTVSVQDDVKVEFTVTLIGPTT
jgi:polyisoprenoid-binding protein YceI